MINVTAPKAHFDCVCSYLKGGECPRPHRSNLFFDDLPQNLVQAFFVPETIGIFDVVENLFDKRTRVEIVRGDSEQVAFGGVVESENVRVGFVARQYAVAVIAHFVKESCDFVVYADPAVAIGWNAFGELQKLFLDKVTCV